MGERGVPDAASIERMIAPMFPGTMGVRIVEAGRDRVVGQLPIRPELGTSGDGSPVAQILHGGAFMAFADTLGAIGTFMNMPPGARTTTIESSTKFLAAARVGTTLTGESTPLHRGRTTMVWQTMIRGEDGRLCAVVTQTQLVMPAEPKS